MKYFLTILVLVAGEIGGFFVFQIIKSPQDTAKANKWSSAAKGILERVVMLFGLLQGYPHILIAFGALKIGTRLRPENSITSDYYYIGNLVSLLLTLIYTAAIKAMWLAYI